MNLLSYFILFVLFSQTTFAALVKCGNPEHILVDGKCVFPPCPEGQVRLNGVCQAPEMPPAPQPVILELPQPESKPASLATTALIYWKEIAGVIAIISAVGLGCRYWSKGAPIRQPSVAPQRAPSIEQAAVDLIRSGAQLFVGNGKRKLKIQTVKK